MGWKLSSSVWVVRQLFRFQNKKLDKLRKKKEEKKEALLEKSLFQGGNGAGRLTAVTHVQRWEQHPP